MAERNAREGRVAAANKSNNGGLFDSFAYFKGVIPSDVYFPNPSVDSVGVHCDENGAPTNSGISRCKKYRSDSASTTFVVRFARDAHRTFYYKTVNNRQVLVPYTVYDNNTYQMSYVSGEAQQFASAHGLGGTTVAVAGNKLPGVAAGSRDCSKLYPTEALKCYQEAKTQPKIEVAAVSSKCDKVPDALKGLCLRAQSSDPKDAVKVGPVFGGIVEKVK